MAHFSALDNLPGMDQVAVRKGLTAEVGGVRIKRHKTNPQQIGFPNIHGKDALDAFTQICGQKNKDKAAEQAIELARSVVDGLAGLFGGKLPMTPIVGPDGKEEFVARPIQMLMREHRGEEVDQAALEGARKLAGWLAKQTGVTFHVSMLAWDPRESAPLSGDEDL